MSRYLQYTVILALLIAACTARAQDLPQVWDLKACIDYAKEKNININTLKLDAQTAGQNLIASKAAVLPNLNGNVSQAITNYKSGLQNTSGFGLSSDITLYNGSYLKNDIKAKTLSLQTANLSVEAAKNDITISITQAYLNILLARENITYLKDLLSTSEAQVKQAEQQFKVGTIAKKDLLQLQATYANDKYTLVTAENTLQQNVLTLKQLLQLPTATAFDISTTDTVTVAPALDNLATAQDKALRTRPEIKSSELNIQLQNTELAKAKSTLRPTLSLGGSLNTGYNNNNPGNYGYQLNNSFYQNLGLTLSIPIFDRKVTKTNVAKANIGIEQARLALQDTKTTLTQNVERAYINVQNANSQYAAAKEQFNYTSEALRISNAALKEGTNNIVENLQQKNLYVQALQSFVQAKYTASLYTRIYNFYTGIPINN
ncbi:transporter [Pedobacter kyungheensis]|uniref:Transporter n=1 Tax=Pedobacter kyungheensis TaxID=1069985 RepID=A0A0C1DQW5_9SPHI|nr:TolC family protein [Pedobacter kyungheensis]KIA96465.1 transporter [Pedobacter kyungheensis]